MDVQQSTRGREDVAGQADSLREEVLVGGGDEQGLKSSADAVNRVAAGVLSNAAGLTFAVVGNVAMFSCALTVFSSLKSFCLSAMSDTPCLG